MSMVLNELAASMIGYQKLNFSYTTSNPKKEQQPVSGGNSEQFSQ
jgi:hypothetical protein